MSDLIKLPRRDIADLVLPEGVVDEIAAMLDEFAFRDALKAHNLKPRSRLLMFGPPGCGKTSLAAALGAALGRDAYAMKISAGTQPHVGEAARAVELAFRQAINAGALLLLDEIDSIGATRTEDRQAAAREQNATLCHLLQLLDNNPDAILVGATNRPDQLDPALRRRFDFELELPPPTHEAAAQFACEVFDRHRWPMPKGWVAPVTSFDAIEKAAISSIRQGVIAKAKGAS